MCDYLSILGLKLIRVSKSGHRKFVINDIFQFVDMYTVHGNYSVATFTPANPVVFICKMLNGTRSDFTQVYTYLYLSVMSTCIYIWKSVMWWKKMFLEKGYLDIVYQRVITPFVFWSTASVCFSKHLDEINLLMQPSVLALRSLNIFLENKRAFTFDYCMRFGCCWVEITLAAPCPHKTVLLNWNLNK